MKRVSLPKKFFAVLLTACIASSLMCTGVSAKEITANRLGFENYELDLDVLHQYMIDVRETMDNYVASAGTDCFLKDDFSYVALGDDTAAANGYAELLASEMSFKLNNYAKFGFKIADTYSLIEKDPEVFKNADLISLGFGTNSFLTSAIVAFFQGSAPEYDWDSIVDDETLTAINEGMASGLAAIKEGIGDTAIMGIKDLPESLMLAIETYLYEAALYFYHLPDIIAKLHSINPDATILVIGVYNPTRGVSINLAGTMLELNDYLDRLVDIVASYIITEGDLPEGAIYVHAPDVTVKLEDKELDVLQLMSEFVRNKGVNLAPSAEGHEYIKDRILEYVNFTDALLGDVNGDGAVDNVDAMLALQYYAGVADVQSVDTSIADVDKNGVVNNVDAMLILQYYAKIINKFPTA